MDLSVIVPCHNEALTLPHQLDALAAQRWSWTWEVIVVDNQSEDDTAQVAAGHSGLSGRVRVVHADAGRGVAYARRAGVESSEARSIAFCDGDDVVAEGWVAAMGEALKEHDLVTGDVEVDSLNEPELAASRGRRLAGTAPRYGELVFLRGNNGGMSRKLWTELGGFDEGFHGLEDIELTLRAAARGRHVHFVRGALIHYRYRVDRQGLWRQGLFYGGSEPMLRRRCGELGLRPPPRSRAWRSWAWLTLHAPAAVLGRDRARWLWTLACRVGALQGGVRELARRLPTR